MVRNMTTMRNGHVETTEGRVTYFDAAGGGLIGYVESNEIGSLACLSTIGGRVIAMRGSFTDCLDFMRDVAEQARA